MKEHQAIYIPERLSALWSRVSHNKITFISAPAGYGKSTLVQRWSELMNKTLIRVEISEAFNEDPEGFRAHLQRLSEENQTRTEIIFVLDHVHRLQHPDTLVRLKDWIMHSHSSIRFILLSRKSLSFMKSCSDLQYQQFQLSPQDLKLSFEESHFWFFQQSEFGTDSTQFSDIHSLTDGCPALLHLAVQHVRSEQGPLMDNKRRVAPSLENYVLEEWLKDIPESIWAGLQPLGVTPYFSIAFAKKILRKEVNPLFYNLEQHGLLSKTFVRNRWLYRFHPVVRAIINERYTSAQGTDISLKEASALFLSEEGLMKEAVEVALESGLPKLALEYMKQIAPELLQAQDYKILRKWFAKLDQSVMSQDQEALSLYHRVSRSADFFTFHAPKDVWSSYVSLNQGSLPFIRQLMTFEGDLNSIFQQTMDVDFPNKYVLPFRHLALAEALYEQNQILSAREQLDQVWNSAGPSHQHPGLSIPALWLTLLCDQAMGRQKETHFLAEEIYYRSLQTSIPIWKRIGQAVKAYVLLQEGHMEDALDWVSEQKEKLPVYWHQWTSFEYFMFARALLSFQEAEEANNLLRRMLTAASLEKSPGVKLERRILQTIAAIHLERHEEAGSYIRNALEIGWKYGYKRLFLEHDPMLFLAINEVQEELPDHLRSYSEQLLQLGKKEDHKDISENPKLKDALTLREIQVLQYIRQGLSNRTIGDHLHITEGTVKGHLHRIFKKLNVKNRVQAVKAAEGYRMI